MRKMAIRSFLDLEVYKLLYKACLLVHKEIIPKLPENEKFGLKDQMSRASKAPLALIAEGYARKHHLRDWRKYLDQALGECNEMLVHVSLSKDLYGKRFKKGVCEKLIDMYDIGGKQLYNLGKNWRPKEKK